MYNYFGMATIDGQRPSPLVVNVVLDEIRLYSRALSQAQVKLDMNATYNSMTGCPNAITPTTISTSTTTTSTATTNQIKTTCSGHYWPIANQTVTDVITGLNATSLGSPQFVTDRNGVANGAIWVNGTMATAWQLPVDTYFQGDTTITMWVKKIACQVVPYGMFKI
jgi:hypothetical protein